MIRRPGQTWTVLSRAVGAAAGSTFALALLVCGCVFAAMAGPGLSLHTRSQALHQTLAGLSDTTKSVQVSANWADFTGGMGQAEVGGPINNLTKTQLTESTSEIAHGFAALGLPLAAGEWVSLTTKLLAFPGAGPRAQAGGTPELEVVYRDPLTGNAQIAAGTYASSSVPAGMVGVAATTRTAARFGLHPGSRLSLGSPSGPVMVFVTAILRERAPGSTFWAQDPIAGTPAINALNTPHPYWVGGVFADPGQLAAMQNAFSGPGLELTWDFPLSVGGVNADQAQGLYNSLNRAVTVTPALTGSLAASADSLTVTSQLIPNLSQFLATQAAIETVLLLLFVSLIVVGAAVIVLAAWMIVLRRDGELTMLRARGGSLRQVAAVMTSTAVIAAGPSAVIGAGLAIALIPGAATSVLGWSLAGIAVAAALAGPPLVAAWQHRRAAPASNPALITSAETGRPKRAWRRPVAEVTAGGAAVAGLVVLHDQGLPAGGGIDLYLTLAPVLVAIPVVLVTLRLYPLAVRGLLALSARGAGATGFVALSRAARSSLTGVLPAFALVLALSLATFAGMVSQPGHHPRRDRRLLADHRGRRADQYRSHVRPGHPGRGQGDRRGPRRAPGHRRVEHELANAVRPGDNGGRRRPGRLRGPGRGHPVPGPLSSQDRHRAGRRTVLGRHGAGARLAVGCRHPRRGGDPAQLAVPDGTVQGTGRGHPEQHPRPAGRRRFRRHADRDPARTGRLARA